MVGKSSQRIQDIWTVLFVATAAFIGVGVAWQAFSSRGSALAGEPTQEGKASSKAPRLPDDLVAVADAQYAPLDGLAPGSREAQDRQRQAAQQLGLPLEVKTQKTGIVFRLVPSGSFTMGSPKAEQDPCVKAGASRELVQGETQHQVTMTKPFYCGKFEVTQGQWQTVMGSNPSYFKNAGEDAPVEQVSWDDCQAFVKKLCQVEGGGGRDVSIVDRGRVGVWVSCGDGDGPVQW